MKKLLLFTLLGLRLAAQPVITSQPTNQTLMLGGNVTFSVMATGTGPFNYQWQLNGTNLPNNLITTVAGNGSQGYSGDGGAATNVALNYPYSLVVDSSGNLFIGDQGNNRIRKVDTNGIISTVAGNGSPGYSGDGGVATLARFDHPNGVAVDRSGNLFISDYLNHRIRKVATNGIITTVAGNGNVDYSGDGGAATNYAVSAPLGETVDTAGNLFVACGNMRIRKVDTNGIITTVAGNGSVGYTGDGGMATNAGLMLPSGVAVDISGNLFIADTFNLRIRKVDTNSIITTVAGNGNRAYSGDGGAATNASLNYAYNVAVDGHGNLFIADSSNHRIRKVDTNGIITTIAGNGVLGYSGDGGAATGASLYAPTDIKFDSAGNLFIADDNNNRVRKVAFAGLPTLTLKNATATNAGNYRVIVTSASGSVTSSVATVSLQLPPITPAFTASNSLCTFTWSAVSNLTYQLQCATNLAAPVWLDLGSPVTATNNSVSVTDAVDADGQRFYRVRLWP